MNILSLVLGIIGAVGSIIAIVEFIKRNKLEKELLSTPSKMYNVLKEYKELSNLQGDSFPHSIEYEDVDNDGEKELLIHFPAGAHGSGVKIFKWINFDFEELADLRTDTPSGFEIKDYDNDGELELLTLATNWDSDLPYSGAPRDRLLYKWNGKDFTIIKKIEKAEE